MKIRDTSTWLYGDRAFLLSDYSNLSRGDILTISGSIEAENMERLGIAARVLSIEEVKALPVGAEVITMRLWRQQPRGTILKITDGKGEFEPRRYRGPYDHCGDDPTCSELLALISLPEVSEAELALRNAEQKLESMHQNLRYVRDEIADARKMVEKERS